MSVPGVEGRHAWNSELTLNDRAVWPRYKLKRITGLHSLPDAEDNREPATGRLGEVVRRALRRGKTLTYEGTVEGRTLAQLRQGEDALLGAFAELDEGQMIVSPHPAYGGPSFFYRARALACDIPDEQQAPPKRSTLGFERPFALSLRLADPRFYETQQQGPIPTGPIVQGAGLSLPWILPVIIPGSAASGTVVVTNTGTAPTDPIIDLYGPVTNPRVMNDTLGRELRFKGLTLAEGSFIRVDFKQRTIKLEGTSDFRSKFDRQLSTWWDEGVPGLRRGDNAVRYRGDSISDPARAEITFHHARWG